jgi:hypothetical protein
VFFLRFAGAFLLAVECLSKKLCCIPCKDKSGPSLEAAVTQMLEECAGEIRLIVSDREPAATSPAFRRAIKKNHGISWYFLRQRNHAHLAELYIRYVKTHLSIALAGNPGDERWQKYLQAIVNKHNQSLIKGTTIVRQSVNEINYLSLLEQLYESTEPDMLFNVSSSSNYSKATADVIWKIPIGAKVLVEKSSDYKNPRDKFYKPSEQGGWSEDSYVVAKRVLKSNAQLFLLPAYRLENCKGLYYERHLLPIQF